MRKLTGNQLPKLYHLAVSLIHKTEQRQRQKRCTNESKQTVLRICASGLRQPRRHYAAQVQRPGVDPETAGFALRRGPCRAVR